MKLQQFNLNDTLKSRLASVVDLEFNNIVIDSRKIGENDIFILLKSQNLNEQIDYEKIKNYLTQVQAKTVFVLSEIDLTPIDEFVQHYGKQIISLSDIRTYLGDLIGTSLQIKSPANLPKVVAVTGTNGKTTISQLTAQLLSLAEHKTAIMGTAGNGILQNGKTANLTPSTHTTLEVFAMQHALYDYAQQGADYLSIEASSHGLHQHRLQGTPIRVAIFSNLSRDHLDYHNDMNDYANAKARLFDKNLFPHLTHAIINLDDEYSQTFIDKAKDSDLTVWTYSLHNPQAQFFASHINPSLDGVDLTINTPKGEMIVKSPLLGLFNVANLLASIGASLAMGVDFDKIVKNINVLQGASGRMERVPSKASSFIVDYAHTPDALEQVLKSLKNHCVGSLWAVFGCGGDRDKGKRPLMTQAGLKYADKVILTADNPRSENPLAILKDMQEGLDCESHYKIEIEPDRKSAIEFAVKNAGENDIVVIAGKGHETYQEIMGVRHDFDDRVVVGEMIQRFMK